LFLDGLVGGMVISFLLNTEEQCDDKEFLNIFFLVSATHFASRILQKMANFSTKAAAIDELETFMERQYRKLFPILLHLVRISQFPLLGFLTYKSMKIKIGERDNWTHDLEATRKNDELKFCDANVVHMALFTVAFQLLEGLLVLCTWEVLWSIDSPDDERERREEVAWREEVAGEEGTILGNLKELFLAVGMESFFDAKIADTFLLLGLTLPTSSCIHGVFILFLVIGVVATFTGVVNRLREEAEKLVNRDGIINRWAIFICVTFKFLNIDVETFFLSADCYPWFKH
jgi:hypothetical protein